MSPECCVPSPSFPGLGLASCSPWETSLPRGKREETLKWRKTINNPQQPPGKTDVFVSISWLTSGDVVCDALALLHGGLLRCFWIFMLPRLSQLWQPALIISSLFVQGRMSWEILGLRKNSCTNCLLCETAHYILTVAFPLGFWSPIGALTEILFPGVSQCLN